MKATISIVFLMISIAFGSLATAGEMDEPTDEQATVILDYGGLFIDAPTAANLVVMNVRVFDGDNQLVFSERSKGHSVNLLALDLPDGEYSYEIVSVLETGAGAEEGLQVETETSTRANGSITVYGGEVIEWRQPDGQTFPLKPDEAKLTKPGSALWARLADTMLGLLVPAVQAADLTISDASPSLFFDDTGTSGADWEISGDGIGHQAFLIWDRMGTNAHVPFRIEGLPGAGDNFRSIVVDVDGDIHWADDRMNFDRGVGTLSIGTQDVNGHIFISDSAPAIVFRDESALQQSTMTLDHDQVRFWGQPGGGSFRLVMLYDVNAPQYSMVIGPDGNVGLGTPAPARQLHLKGSNAVFRMDRSSNSAAFMLVRTSGGGTPLKTFVVGTNASGSNNGEFVINDLGTAVSGGGSRRMTINNSGNVNFPGTVTAANIAAPSSRELKKNIEPIDDPLELTQQLEGVRFDWKANDEASLGFIAEDLEEVLPEVVLHDEGTGEMLGVNYASVVPVLVEAIKQQQREMDKQRREITAQRQEITNQQRKVDALVEQLATFQAYEARLAALEASADEGKAQPVIAQNL